MSVLRVKDPNSCAREAEVGDREGKMSLVWLAFKSKDPRAIWMDRDHVIEPISWGRSNWNKSWSEGLVWNSKTWDLDCTPGRLSSESTSSSNSQRDNCLDPSFWKGKTSISRGRMAIIMWSLPAFSCPSAGASGLLFRSTERAISQWTIISLSDIQEVTYPSLTKHHRGSELYLFVSFWKF